MGVSFLLSIKYSWAHVQNQSNLAINNLRSGEELEIAAFCSPGRSQTTPKKVRYDKLRRGGSSFRI